MNFMESFRSAILSVRANKMRSFLTMLGIIIGISSVITIVSLGEAGQKKITGQFATMGTNVINLTVKQRGTVIEQRDLFTLYDVDLIKEKIDNVDAVVPENQGYGDVFVGKDSNGAGMLGVNDDHTKIVKLDMLDGRFLNKHDVETGRNVVVIDELTAKKFFKTVKAAGKKIRYKVDDNNINLTVIGVMKHPNGSFAADFDGNFWGLTYVPITITDKIFPNSDIMKISVVLKDMKNSKVTTSKIIRLIEKHHRNTGKYNAEEGFKELDKLNEILGMITAGVGAIAAISLLVGGIGVMNIMLVSVTERTREIGIRKAIGAKRRDIMIQFLTESIILCLIGGIIGMSLGIGMGYLGGKLIKVTVTPSFKTILIAFIFSSSVGIFFGLYPANKAAKLNPIEALRYE